MKLLFLLPLILMAAPIIKSNTIEYYNKNAQAFYERTKSIPKMSELHTIFLHHLPQKALILDAGCGIGRDAKYFLTLGHTVFAFDASLEMVKYAKEELEDNVFSMTFQELTFYEKFDGIWANASLLHIPYEETKEVYKRLYNALKPGGILYASYQYGSSHRFYDNRDFYDMNETTILPYFDGLFKIIELHKTPDARSLDRTWLNIVARKVVPSDKTTLMRKLDLRQRRVFLLFHDFEVVTSSQIKELLCLQPSTNAQLCATWVKEGFLEIVDPSNKGRKYKLSKQYEDIVVKHLK